MLDAQQFDLFGILRAPQDLDLQSKVAYVLEHHPETRDDDRLLILWYWWEWNGLNAMLDRQTFEVLCVWSANAEQPETIRRRRQELQQLRSGTGCLCPSPEVAEHRRQQDGAGPVGRRR